MIRLVHVNPGGRDEPLSLRLSRRRLNTCLKYHALSYPWGDKHDRVEVMVDGKPIRVTRNLYRALLQYRESLSLRVVGDMIFDSWTLQEQTTGLWVDSLCINQEDEDEVVEQVTEMGSLYSSAEKVVIWLGPGAENIEHLSSVFDIARRFDNDEPDVTLSDGEAVRAAMCLHKLVKEMPWFSRVWVIQEASLARNDPVVMAGEAQCHFRGLVNLWYHLGRKCNSTVRALLTTTAQIPAFDALRDWCQEEARWFLSPAVQLNKILPNVMNFKSEKPHDQIYGVLGLLGTESRPEWLRVDYKQLPQKLFWEVTVNILSDTGDLAIINRTRSGGQLGVPSWVPNFEDTIFGPNLPGGPYRSRRSIAFSPDRKIMMAEGVLLGHCVAVSVPQAPRVGESKQSRDQSIVDGAKGIMEAIIHPAAKMQNRTLQECKAQFVKGARELAPKPTTLEEDLGNFELTLDGQPQWNSLGLNGACLSPMLLTDRSCVAMLQVERGSCDMPQIGDTMVVLKGASYPYLLRSVGDAMEEYSFLGTCRLLDGLVSCFDDSFFARRETRTYKLV